MNRPRPDRRDAAPGWALVALGALLGITLVVLYYEVTVIGGGIPACL